MVQAVGSDACLEQAAEQRVVRATATSPKSSSRDLGLGGSELRSYRQSSMYLAVDLHDAEVELVEGLATSAGRLLASSRLQND